MNILVLTNPSYGCYGYSIVAKNLVRGLREAGHNAVIIGTVTAGNLIRDEYGNANIPPYFDQYAKYALRQYMKGFNADCVITILDCWTPGTYEIPDIVHRHKIPIIAHVTARSDPLSPWWSTYLEKCDHIIAPSLFGRNLVEQVFPQRCSYIQHGIDPEIFKRDEKARDEMRKMMGYGDKFVFLSTGRNKGIQKRWDILLKAYKTLLIQVPEAREDTVLHLHTNPHEIGAIDLEQMRFMGFNDLGKEHVTFSTVKFNGRGLELCNADDPRAMLLNPNWGLDERGMARLYNMADCGITSGEGESFNLPQMEGQACGLPQIAPDHSVFPEMIKYPKSGLLAEIATDVTTPTLTDVRLADPVHMAKCMLKMYRDAEFRKTCSENAIKNARMFTWKEVVDKWLLIIDKVTEPKKIDYSGKIMFNLGI